MTSPPSWERRWLVIRLSLLFCALAILAAMFGHMAEAVATTTITMSFSTGFAIIGSYVFGATWQDINLHPRQP
jgi:uncharacterized membrane protein